ncbi:MAG: ABC transporter ATP-binding protein [Sarcina sp.]
MCNILEVKNIVKSFGDKKILNNISFEIKKGEIVGLVGLNGAGKSTLISIILGLLSSDSGKVLFNEINKNILSRGVMLQEVSMPENIKVVELIKMILKFSKKKMDLNELLQISNLYTEKNFYCNKLSGGKQRALQFCLAIANDPDILFLDEPTVGMDFEAKNKFWEYIKKIAQNKTIILTSHNINEIENFSNRILVLNNSQIIFDGDMIGLNKLNKFSKCIYISKSTSLIELLKNDELLEVNEFTLTDNNILIYSNNISKCIESLISKGILLENIEIKNLGLETFLKEKLC